ASSFANTSGGDLVFGMQEEKGIPTQIVGVISSDLDKEILRLEQAMDSGLEPRIRRNFWVVPCEDDKSVVVLRIERSWSGPHRVSFQDSGRFWGRNSAGKYPLDVNELRAAFTLSSTVMERIRGFRTDRIIAISNNETPVPMNPGPKMVMHCIPIESFAGQSQYDLIPFLRDYARLPGLGGTGFSRRLNLDGLLVGDGQGTYVGSTYTHLYRSGLIEVVTGPSGLFFEKEGQKWIGTEIYERNLLNYLATCFRVFREIEASGPVVVAMTLTNARGLAMSIPMAYINNSSLIDRDTLVLPETLVQDLTVEPVKVLRPMFDLIWNACGFEGSRNFDEEGNWVQRRF
ncbi:MAG: ATP-binding protein, partial [Terracidiphilus sp.]